MRESPCFMKYREWHINLENITSVYYYEDSNEVDTFCDVFLVGNDPEKPYFSLTNDEADAFFYNFKSAIQWRKP